MFTRSQQGAVDVIHGDDSLNLEHISDVEKVFTECERHGQPRIVLDLKNVSLIDSTGLELLLDVRDRCLQKGGALKLARPNHLCRDILEITGVAARLEIFDDTVTAAGSFAQ